MLIEEKLYYDQLLMILDSQRRGVMHSLLRAEIPMVSDLVNISKTTSVRPPEQNELSSEESSTGGGDAIVVRDGAVLAHEDASCVVESGKSKVRVTVPIPSFMWKDLKVYGPFDIGEETLIFSEVADLLIRKGRAIKV